MTDFRALCAELVHLNEVEVDDWTRKWADAVNRTKAALAQPEATIDPWREAVIHALVCNCILNEENSNDPRKAVSDLISWEHQLARDPLVSSAQPEPQGPPEKCWLDDEPELYPSPSVLDLLLENND